MRTRDVIKEHLVAIKKGDFILHGVDLAQVLWYVAMRVHWARTSIFVVVATDDGLEQSKLRRRGEEATHVNEDDGQGTKKDGGVLAADETAGSVCLHGSRVEERRQLVKSVLAIVFLSVFEGSVHIGMINVLSRLRGTDRPAYFSRL